MTTPNRCTALRTTRPRPAIGLGVSHPCPRRRTHANHTARSRPTTASSNTDSDQHAGDIPTPPRPTIVTGDAFVHKRHRRHYDLTHRHPSHNSDGRSAHRAHPKRSDQCPLTGLDVPTEPQYNSAQQVRVCMSARLGHDSRVAMVARAVLTRPAGTTAGPARTTPPGPARTDSAYTATIAYATHTHRIKRAERALGNPASTGPLTRSVEYRRHRLLLVSSPPWGDFLLNVLHDDVVAEFIRSE